MNKRGFTLLEIIISTIILALVIGGLANIFVVGKRRIVYSRSKIQTAELGRLFLGPLQNDVRQDEWGNNCVSANIGCPGQQTLDFIPYTPTYEISNLAGTNLQKVKLTISWDEPAP